jgi:hypothetical protein
MGSGWRRTGSRQLIQKPPVPVSIVILFRLRVAAEHTSFQQVSHVLIIFANWYEIVDLVYLRWMGNRNTSTILRAIK